MGDDPATRYFFIGAVLWLICLVPWAIDVTAHLHGTMHHIAIGSTIALLILGCVILVFGIIKAFRSK